MTLSIVKPQPVNRANEIAKTVCNQALGAIYALTDAGSTVHELTWRCGKAVLRIDRPPPFVHGVETVRSHAARSVERVYAATFRDVQIEWIEHEDKPRITRGAARC
jgi:hypothetical protein